MKTYGTFRKYSRSTWAYFKHTPGSTPNGNYIKFGNEENDTQSNSFELICTNEKDGLSDYDFVKIEQWNSLLKNVLSA